MRKTIYSQKIIFSLIVLFCSIQCITYANNSCNSINGICLSEDSLENDFSFLVIGHAYGSQNKSVFPAQSLIHGIELINDIHPDFMILLGDNFKKADSIHILYFKKLFLDKLSFPVWNAVGNHDLNTNDSNHERNYNTYNKHFTQKTYFSFDIKSSLFIVLDTELAIKNGQTNGTIAGSQKTFLFETINSFADKKQSTQKNIFICSHQEINLNETNNYSSDIYPFLSKIADREINIYILSGDMGKRSNSLYSIEDKNGRIKYIHTHIADEIQDKILRINVKNNGSVHIFPVSLFNLPVGHIEDYSIINAETDEFKPSIIVKIKNRLFSRLFYEGALFLFLILIFLLFARKFFNHKN